MPLNFIATARCGSSRGERVPADAAAFAQQSGATHAGIAMDSRSPQFVAALHDAGVGVFASTADAPEDIGTSRWQGARPFFSYSTMNPVEGSMLKSNF
ncbi:MAG: hypothetical protein WBW84_20780 [Acidobacteriaceae bacterium]